MQERSSTGPRSEAGAEVDGKAEAPLPPIVQQLCADMNDAFKKGEMAIVLQHYECLREESQPRDSDEDGERDSPVTSSHRTVLYAWGRALLAAERLSGGDPEHVAEIVGAYSYSYGHLHGTDYLYALSLREDTVLDALCEFLRHEGRLSEAAVEGVLQRYTDLASDDVAKVLQLMSTHGIALSYSLREQLERHYVLRMRKEDPEKVLDEMQHHGIQPVSVRPFTFVFMKPPPLQAGRSYIGYYLDMLDLGIRPVDSTFRILLSKYNSPYQPAAAAAAPPESSEATKASTDGHQSSGSRESPGRWNGEAQEGASDGARPVADPASAVDIIRRAVISSSDRELYFHFRRLSKGVTEFSGLYRRPLGLFFVFGCHHDGLEAIQKLIKWIQVEGSGMHSIVLNKLLLFAEDREQIENVLEMFTAYNLRPTSRTVTCLVSKCKPRGRMDQAYQWVCAVLERHGCVLYSSCAAVVEYLVSINARARVLHLLAQLLTYSITHHSYSAVAFRRAPKGAPSATDPEAATDVGDGVDGAEGDEDFAGGAGSSCQPTTSTECAMYVTCMKLGPFDWAYGLLGLVVADGFRPTLQMKRLMTSLARDPISAELVGQLGRCKWNVRRMVRHPPIMSPQPGCGPSLLSAMQAAMREMKLSEEVAQLYTQLFHDRVRLEAQLLHGWEQIDENDLGDTSELAGAESVGES